MAHAPKINIRALRKKGILDETRFFRLLSENNNYIDPKAAKELYMGLVRLLTKELKENGVVRLPHLGVMALVKQKDKMALAGKIRRVITGKYILKFYPKEAWKKYFTKLEGKSGLAGKLDPREKILGQNLDHLV